MRRIEMIDGRAPGTAALAVAIVALVVAGATAGTPDAVLQGPAGEFQPARSGHYLAWERNSAASPQHYDVFAKAVGRSRFKVNGRSTEAASGGIDGDLLVYQQWKKSGSDLKLFDLRKKRRSDAPRKVNSRHWEYWPSLSGRWLLFGRRKGDGARRIILFDRRSGKTRTLARTGSKKSFAAPGQVNGSWVVWWKCTPATACNVWRYNIHSRKRMEVPNPGRYQRAASVTPQGTVYYVRSGADCGSSVKLMRYAPGAPSKLLVELPAGEDAHDTYAFSPRSKKTKVLYERNTCGQPAVSDVWQVLQPRLRSLKVTKRGGGGGTVTSAPVGVTCGSDCLQPFRAGISVTLTATAEASSNFTGWGGVCSGQASKCTIKMNEARRAVAFFDPASAFSVSVTKRGDGRGKVTSAPEGIACGSDCWQSYRAGTGITLTAAPHKNSRFVRWKRACSGSGKCKLTVDRVRSVVAVFKAKKGASSRQVPGYLFTRGASPEPAP
ncbi:MAG: hypothetical protein ABR529_11920 [Actinomycetota bacterium]